MSLQNNKPIGFIPTKDAEAARPFYADTLGLKLISQDQFALVFQVGPAPGTMLRIVCAGDPTPAPFTIYGWEVDDIHATIAELSAKGVEFLRYGYFEQDEAGVWLAPGGSSVAWFKDPDGNTLSISQHV
jgi:catechol 2,3-dioxygenase-like lactoylglutathione lyase family enzyme